jgi:hypothetical protein
MARTTGFCADRDGVAFAQSDCIEVGGTSLRCSLVKMVCGSTIISESASRDLTVPVLSWSD